MNTRGGIGNAPLFVLIKISSEEEFFLSIYHWVCSELVKETDITPNATTKFR
jgi:hypothetical protein